MVNHNGRLNFSDIHLGTQYILPMKFMFIDLRRPYTSSRPYRKEVEHMNLCCDCRHFSSLSSFPCRKNRFPTQDYELPVGAKLPRLGGGGKACYRSIKQVCPVAYGLSKYILVF